MPHRVLFPFTSVEQKASDDWVSVCVWTLTIKPLGLFIVCANRYYVTNQLRMLLNILLLSARWCCAVNQQRSSHLVAGLLWAD